MKKSELLKIYKEWIKVEEVFFTKGYPTSKCKESWNIFNSNYKEVVKMLEESSSPLEFFDLFVYKWHAFRLEKSLLNSIFLERFTNIFAIAMLSEMEWEDEDSEVRRND